MAGHNRRLVGDARVGPYRILRLINRGGQGSVYLGYDKRLHRRVAIKIYRLPRDRAARKRLLHEARVVASMQSPKVVQIHDVIESPEHLAMVMEYVPGCDLEEMLASVRPSLASILTIAADIAGALTVARQQRIVHGDLKAGNVLVAANGRVKLTDFGIARSAAGGHSAAASPSSVSPEQYLGQPLDERSDLFALGCLLYRMLTGVQPFHRDGQLDPRALLEQAPPPVQQLAPPDLELPPQLVALVDALLQKSPPNRPSGTRVVRQILRRISRGIPLAASNSLLAEARPCFRPESAEDIPPPVPAELGQEGRSWRSGRGERGRLTLPVTWRWPVAGIAAVSVIAVAAVLALTPGETPVHIAAPELRLAPGMKLPKEISSLWLVEEVTAAVSERLGPLRITGPVGASPITTLYADPALREPPTAKEQLELGLRCVDMLCVFAVSRSWGDRQLNQQAVLFPDMSSRQWRDIVRSTTRALYP